MTTTTNEPTSQHLAESHLFRRAWAFNWPLTLTVLLNLALIPLLLIASAVDPKVILGVNGWVKPLKFAISIAIYSATFLWLLTFVQGRRRWVQLAANATALGMLIEIVLIMLQVVRGTTSHFNVATPFDAAVFGVMGMMIMVAAVMNLLLAIWLIFQKMPDPVLAWGLRLGVAISFFGMLIGARMTAGPTPEQMAALQAGGQMTVVGAHSIGVADGGAGLPLVGWSTEGGDLRVGHFAGLHALQVLPFVAFVLTRPAARRRFTTRQRLVLTWIAGLSYLGLTALLTWQALRGQPLVAPDALTVSVLIAWIGATAIAAMAAVATPEH